MYAIDSGNRLHKLHTPPVINPEQALPPVSVGHGISEEVPALR